jgi:hypothetical protein
MAARRAQHSNCRSFSSHNIECDSMTTHPRRLVRIAACSVLGLCAIHSVGASELPDWSGWWGQGDAPSRSFISNPPPLRKERRSQMARRQPGQIGPGLYCGPATFTGFNGSFVVNFEFLFTPGRVTITNEGGMIRRIYTDGRPEPTNPEPSSTGTSVGHWEGQTLVIETIGISPNAQLGRFGAIGKNARIVEHIRLKQKDILESEVETSAPEVFTATDRRSYLSGRVPGKQSPLEANFCSERDRSYDAKSGKERFDTTPPPNLPPPPAP